MKKSGSPAWFKPLQRLNDMADLADARRLAGIAFDLVALRSEMRGRDEHGTVKPADFKPRPEETPVAVRNAHFFNAVLDMREQRVAPVNIAFGRPAAVWVVDAPVRLAMYHR